MKGKKEQKDNGAKSFRSIKQMWEFVDRFVLIHQITHEEEEAFAAAPTSYDDMTEEDWQKEHEAQIEGERQLKHEAKFNKVRKFLNIGIEAKRDDPDSKLFQTATELLDFVDRCESDPSSVNRYERKKFRTALIRYKELLKGEATSAEKPAETKKDIAPIEKEKEKFKIIGWLLKKTSHLVGAIIVAIIGGIIVAILIDIFGDFGWLEGIKTFIYKILYVT
jgi:hypothetical protein